ncbi:MAG: hypothetical protein LBQ10_08315, partial [Desulfovibrio sp.]|nr:hypothetical protein [Desulfovibrio sp.]
QEAFFINLGFTVVEKDVLPQKIWADCVNCPKYPDCDEIAVLLDISGNKNKPSASVADTSPPSPTEKEKNCG